MLVHDIKKKRREWVITSRRLRRSLVVEGGSRRLFPASLSFSSSSFSEEDILCREASKKLCAEMHWKSHHFYSPKWNCLNWQWTTQHKPRNGVLRQSVGHASRDYQKGSFGFWPTYEFWLNCGFSNPVLYCAVLGFFGFGSLKSKSPFYNTQALLSCTLPLALNSWFWVLSKSIPGTHIKLQSCPFRILEFESNNESTSYGKHLEEYI